MEPAPVRTLDISALSRAYARVLLSQRLWRGLAMSMFQASMMLLAALGILVLMGLFEPRLVRGKPMRAGGMILVLVVVAVLAAALSFLLLKVLAAFGRGSRPVAYVFLGVVVVLHAPLVLLDLRHLVELWPHLGLQAFMVAALVLRIAFAVGLGAGLLALLRVHDAERPALLDPGMGQGLASELPWVLGMPHLGARLRNRRLVVWPLILLAGLLEGSAFYWLVMLAGRFEDAAFKLEAFAARGDSGFFLVSAPFFLLLVLIPSWALYRLMIRGARWLRLKARLLALESAPEAVTTDARSPVLFLRAFAHEQVPLRAARMPWLVRTFDPGTEYGTLEDMLVHELAFLGPVVTLADPGRSELPVGAARWHVDGQGWQGFVEGQMQRAGLVVLVVAETAGVRWEVEALRSAGALDRTVFVFRPESTQDRPLLGSLAAWLEIAPATVNDAVGEGARNVLALAAPHGRAPLLAVSRGLSEIDYEVALRMAVQEHVLARQERAA